MRRGSWRRGCGPRTRGRPGSSAAGVGAVLYVRLLCCGGMKGETVLPLRVRDDGLQRWAGFELDARCCVGWEMELPCCEEGSLAAIGVTGGSNMKQGSC